MPENITKLPSGAYLAQVTVGKSRPSKSFDSLREAVAWRDQQRVLAKATKRKALGDVHTLRQAIQKYHDEIAPEHKGTRWEQLRCGVFLRDIDLPLTLPIGRVTDEHVDRWRERRESEVSPASVRREMSLLGSIFTAAARDWKWIHDTPMKGVKPPTAPPGRDIVLTRPQIKAMLRALGYRRRRPESMSEVVANMLLLALRTGMRSGEMEGLAWDHVHTAYVCLPKTKNGDARDVPLPRKARPIIERMRGWSQDRVFPITAQSRDALWRAARARAKLSGFTFHDSRHSARCRRPSPDAQWSRRWPSAGARLTGFPRCAAG
ncbi:MAG: tyrosine-type recombinase/integrase [Desulfovibrionaceae bacterium]|jgi:integrase|nr:tyrosine-type recombinase/integrase [Desulfovibrionaceae bacterium]